MSWITFSPFSRYRTSFIQVPSMFATTLSAGTCFAFVHPSCSALPTM